MLGSAAAMRPAKPLVLDPNWRVVSNEFVNAAASDGYAAIVNGYTSAGQLMLINERTGRQRMLSPPNCSPLGPADGLIPGLIFGGRSLMVGCGNPGLPRFAYMLYDISARRWTPFTISPRCPGSCRAVGIGRYWVKLLSNDEVMNYSPDVAYLQNIQTGQLKRDPITAGGRIFDDLSWPSGSRPLCSPLRYPSMLTHNGPQPGSLTFYGQFALVGDRLRRCHSRLNLRVTATVTSGGLVLPTLASSRAVISSDGKTLKGWLLPSLRRLIIKPPAATQTLVPPQSLPGATNGVVPVAVSDRNIYVRPAYGTQQVWAASLLRPGGREG
jgi:hypothetical protein